MTWREGQLIKVPPQYTSQECPKCAHTEANNRKTQDTFSCLRCGYTNPFNFVAATNILRRGTPHLPAGAIIGKPSKQEPKK